MITVSVQKDNRLVQLPAESVETLTDFKHRWVHMINPNDREIEFVEEVAGVPADVLKAALDEDEKPRIEKEDEYLLVLVDIPVMEDDEDTGTITYSTLPMSIRASGACSRRPED